MSTPVTPPDAVQEYWQIGNNGSGARIWFVWRVGADGQHEYVERQDGQVSRYTREGAAKVARGLNTKLADQ